MKLNKYIDHTNLKVDATGEDIKKLCEEAKVNNFKSVCIPPYYISLAKECLKDSEVLIDTVIGFPNGYMTMDTKVYEASDVISKGADEVDMVINIAALKNNDYDYVINEIRKIREVTKNHILKVIIETCLLTKEEIVKMTEICNREKVDFIKTSTGFSLSGANREDVELMNKNKKDGLKIKASGGIRDYDKVVEMINAGAERIGTSSGITIIKNKK